MAWTEFTRAQHSRKNERYPREYEHATLLALEERSRASGAPGIADVFTGIIHSGEVVSTGPFLRLADGRSAMLYVGVSAQGDFRRFPGSSPGWTRRGADTRAP